MHGSILPKLILPLTAVAAWASVFTCISKLVKPRTSLPATARAQLTPLPTVPCLFSV